MRYVICKSFLTALGAAALTACGGGGGDTPAGSAATSTAMFPIETAFQLLINQPQNFNLSATYQGQSFQLSWATNPQANASFEGAVRRARQSVVTLRSGGAVIGTSSEISYYDLTAAKPIGTVASDGSYTLITPLATFPSSATVGMQGVGWTSVTYFDASKAIKTGDGTLNWSLDADTATTAWLCGNSVNHFTNGSSNVTSSECYKINTSGQILGAKATVVSQGVTLNFQ